MRVAFLGSSCAPAAATLAALLEDWPPPNELSRADLAAHPKLVSVILAGSSREPPGAVETEAAEAEIPVTWVASATDVAEILRAAAPDVAVAACFPWRLPRAAREMPRLGILNVHPSLLPLGRGPEPVFWSLRRGEQTTGVTVHRMDAGLDTGPIVAQREMAIPSGIRAPDLEDSLMVLGGRLVAAALPGLAAGSLQPRPQQNEAATYAPLPSPADWTMMTLLPAAWAWRFARGVAPLRGPLTVIAGGAAIPVRDAVAWSPDERLPRPLIEEAEGTFRVRFSPGWVRFLRP